MFDGITHKLKLFISYSHEDEQLKSHLDKHLIMLKRSGKVEVWNDRQLIAVQGWDLPKGARHVTDFPDKDDAFADCFRHPLSGRQYVAQKVIL